MSKKKLSPQRPPESYSSNPFKQLKGFAVSESADIPPQAESPVVDPSVDKERSFAEEMEFLGVDPLAGGGRLVRETPAAAPDRPDSRNPEPSDEELFLGSLGQLDVHFSDQVPTPAKPAKPRRLKQLKLGRLTPDASLDLHGLQRHQVAEKIDYFLRSAIRLQWQTLLIITGRGLHSADGETVLRDEVEKYLLGEGKSLIAEWGRAPRQYGGEGALVVFLKKMTAENE